VAAGIVLAGAYRAMTSLRIVICRTSALARKADLNALFPYVAFVPRADIAENPSARPLSANGGPSAHQPKGFAPLSDLQLDLAWPPSLVEPRFQRAVYTSMTLANIRGGVHTSCLRTMTCAIGLPHRSVGLFDGSCVVDDVACFRLRNPCR